MTDLAKKIMEFEIKLSIFQGQQENVLGFIALKHGKKEFMDHLKFIVKSNTAGKWAKLAAAEMLRQDNLWGDAPPVEKMQ